METITNEQIKELFEASFPMYSVVSIWENYGKERLYFGGSHSKVGYIDLVTKKLVELHNWNPKSAEYINEIGPKMDRIRNWAKELN